MKWNINQRIAILWLLLFSRAIAQAQTQQGATSSSSSNAAPVRLAIISESSDAAIPADVLTASLSANPEIQLVERDEINKIRREQSLAAANRDYLKLGNVLGADGLLLLDVLKTRQATNLTTRLIAVKPGVVLTDGSFPWPVIEPVPWAQNVASGLALMLPKMAVRLNEAVPISVVNFRFAVQSTEAPETERQLKLLAIQRLSRERQFFVLERQRMQLLSEEKALKFDDSAFWNGSYLLEGVVDQNGYSSERITINARLTPPKGGQPLLLEVAGNRTNIAEVVNQLAMKVTDLLRVNSSVKEWNAVDEAAQYFEEAQWALRWGVLPEAQAAAESAWALGKHDMACATARVKAYLVAPETGGYQQGEFTNPHDVQEVVHEVRENLGTNRPWGLVLREANWGGVKNVNYVWVGKQPDARSIGFVTQALEQYDAFSRTLAPGEPKADSAWYRLGIDALTTASQVLQHFHFVPESQQPVADELAQLRLLARSVATRLSQSPSVHDGYFIEDRAVSYDDLHHFSEQPSIYGCKVKWGCFWQEKPEDCIATYRELMASPVFRYVHSDFWLRDLQTPRLTAWNETDRKRIPAVWQDFLQELDGSTNVLLRLEGKALRLADANNDQELEAAFTNLFDTLLANRELLAANPVDVTYLNWGTDELVSRACSGVVSEKKQALQDRFYKQYVPQLEAIHNEYRTKTLPAAQFRSVFENQKRYLREQRPYEFIKFVDLFSSENYTREQARELLPLLSAYKSNLVAQSEKLSGQEKFKLQSAIGHIAGIETRVNHLLNPPARNPALPPAQDDHAHGIVMGVRPLPRTAQPEATASNILAVNTFFPLPLEHFKVNQPQETLSNLKLSILGFDGTRLWCDLRFNHDYEIEGDNGFMKWTNIAHRAAAILNPKNGEWKFIDYPELQSPWYLAKPEFGGRFQDGFYISGVEYLRHCDSNGQRWETVNAPWQKPPQLFPLKARLLAANDEAIFEILDHGHTIKILASCRRRPAVSALDSLDHLGNPKLFDGPGNSVCVAIGNKIFRWDEKDWQELLTADGAQRAEVLDGAVIFCFDSIPSARQPAQLWFWDETTASPKLAIYEKPRLQPFEPPMVRQVSVPKENPLWNALEDDALVKAPAACFQSNLYFFTEHAAVTNKADSKSQTHWTIQERNGYHARLVCLTRGLTEPVVIPLKFDLERGQPPFESLASRMAVAQIPSLMTRPRLLFTQELLYLGQESTPGIWAVPMAELDSAVTGQKQIMVANEQKRLVEAAQAAETAKLEAQAVLAKYDHRHSGVLDPEEKEQALADPDFIKAELDKIDVNHNGFLDPPETLYFDANSNKVLDASEEAGINTAQHLLTVALLKKFDLDRDGSLDQEEFNALVQSVWPAKPFPAMIRQPFPDANHDGKVDLVELENYLRLRTVHGFGTLHITPPSASNPMDGPQFFKAAIEAYWSNPNQTRLPFRAMRQNTNFMHTLPQPGLTNAYHP